MVTRTIIGAAALAAPTLLAACHQPATRPATKPAAPPQATTPVLPSQPPGPPTAANIPLPERRPPPDTEDEFKHRLAQRITLTNPEAVFSGAIPPLLTAIVVLEMKVDDEGGLRSLRVVRARDPKAAAIAEQIMRAAAPYPKPGKLMRPHHRSFEFSETFLFNKDYRFQLRTLAPVQ